MDALKILDFHETQNVPRIIWFGEAGPFGLYVLSSLLIHLIMGEGMQRQQERMRRETWML